MTVADETRAAEYRRQMSARIINKRLREAALRGDPSALAALRILYRPLLPGQCVPLIGER